MSRVLFPWFVLFLCALVLLPPIAVPALRVQAEEKTVAGDDDLVKRIKRSIDESIDFLRSQQVKANGSWEVGLSNGFVGGKTALVLLALHNAGVKSNDEAFQAGLKYLRTIPPSKTYVVGLQTMVFALVKEEQDKPRIERNVKWLLAARMAGGWGYDGPKPREALGGDNSNSQYAMLGLHEAIQAGFKVDEETLKEVQSFYVRTQKDGGWCYDALRPRANSMTMTTAGLCNLIITGMDLAKGKAILRADGSAANCGEYIDNETVAKALNWIGRAHPAEINADAVTRFNSPFYCLYGIERTGRLTGQRFFGGHDWYEVGCRWLVDVQKADGSWGGASGLGTHDSQPVIATSFALLFLAKGKTPVLISKLAYGGKADMGWNNKRSDVKHLVEFCSKNLFKDEPLAWQNFDVRNIDAPNEASRKALAAQLLQSPIVFFNGHDYAPRDKEEDILKEYVSNGGFIFAECCCGKAQSPNFDKDFRKLMNRLFPDAKLEPLEADHPVWLASGKFAISPRDFPLEGIKQGCKTVVIYSPVPLAGYWEGNLHNGKESERGQKAFQLGANIVAYATGMEVPRQRLSRVEITGTPKTETVRRGFLQVGQLRHEGDWQPAPKAMSNLMAEARKVGLDVALTTKAIYPSDEAVKAYRFLYMHGRNNFTAKKEDLQHLRFALKTGVVLLADACCGSKNFDGAFRRFIGELFADDKLKLEEIPVTDDLYSAELNGEEIRTVRRREMPAGGTRVDPEFKTVKPALEGVKYKGRWIVIYSKYDIGCALEKHSSPDCQGHDAASALKLARAAVLNALKR
jgi:hypothetical protein